MGPNSATAGGQDTLSIVRFIEHTIVIHAGETVEWTNSDPVTPHTITFGKEPANPMPSSANVDDGRRRGAFRYHQFHVRQRAFGIRQGGGARAHRASAIAAQRNSFSRQVHQGREVPLHLRSS
jgi:plastocyanin